MQPTAWLQETREVTARTKARYADVQLSQLGLQLARAVAIALRGALRRLLMQAGAYLLGYLAIHQRTEHLLHLLPHGCRQVGTDKLLEVGKGGG